MDFFAEKEKVTIIPNFSEHKISLISVCHSMSAFSIKILLNLTPLPLGGFWPLQPCYAHQSAPMVSPQPKAETEM